MVKYRTAVNLLDNSDFTNPVNQRNAGTVANDHVIDRWYGFRTTEGSVSIITGGITATGDAYLQQRLPSGTLKSGVVYTIAVYYLDGTIDVNTNGDYAILDQFDVVNNIKPNGKTIAHVALYEGSYAAETLPPYVPKGYAAELAECQRRFHVYETESARPTKPLDCCPPMELAPGTTEITQGTLTVDGKTLYYNSTEL